MVSVDHPRPSQLQYPYLVFAVHINQTSNHASFTFYRIQGTEPLTLILFWSSSVKQESFKRHLALLYLCIRTLHWLCWLRTFTLSCTFVLNFYLLLNFFKDFVSLYIVPWRHMCTRCRDCIHHRSLGDSKLDIKF